MALPIPDPAPVTVATAKLRSSLFAAISALLCFRLTGRFGLSSQVWTCFLIGAGLRGQAASTELGVCVSIETNKQVALRFLKAMGEQGYSVFGDPELVTEDFQWWVQGRGTFTGPQMLEITKVYGDQYAGPGVRTVTGITAEGDRVAVEYEGNTPLKAGGAYANTYHSLFVIRDGRIASGREYYDTAYARSVLRRE